MTRFNTSRQGYALGLVLAATALATATLCTSASAAFLTVYGGPTYSSSTGGYLASDGGFFAIGAGRNVQGSVNDAGIAVGNFTRTDVPLTSTPVDVRTVSVRWSASQAPFEIANGEVGGSTQTTAMNNSGAIVGSRYSGVVQTKSLTFSSSDSTNANLNAARWPAPGSSVQTLTPLDPTGRQSAVAWAVNAQGVAVGSAKKSSTVRAVRWDAAGAATELGILDPDPNAIMGVANALAVNSAGTAVGVVGAGFDTIEPVRWDANTTTATRLGNLGGPAGVIVKGSAVALNDAGDAVGFVQKYNASGTALGTRAVRWAAGGTTATELGSLPVDSSGLGTITAVDINNSGAVIGNLQLGNFATGTIRGLLWPAGSTTPIELQTLGNFASSVFPPATSSAVDINSQGITVGQASGIKPSGLFGTPIPLHAVYWGADGVPVDLNSLIDPASNWVLTSAFAISDTNWVLGSGTFDPDGAGSQAGYARMFLLQVPEPSGIVLGGLGAVVAFGVRRRR